MIKKVLLKRLKNIVDNSKITKENKTNQLGIKSIGYTVREELFLEARKLLEKLNNQEKLINYRKLNFRGGSNIDYDFSNFRPLREFFRAIYYEEILIPGVEREQDEFNDVLDILKRYREHKSGF